MKLSTLLSPFATAINKDCEVTGIHNDSRQIKPGDLFIAYPGAAADGRKYIAKAIEQGAAAVVYEPENGAFDQSFDQLHSEVPCLALPGVAKQLAAIASRFYGDPSKDLQITGITGTNGKTTIAYLLAQAYECLGMDSAYIGTIGQGKVNELQPLLNTTPDGLCLQQLFYEYKQSGIGQICMEVSSHALSLNRVDHVNFTKAVYSNLSHEHLDFHHTLEAYALAKAKLFAMPDLKAAIINQDDPYAELMASQLHSACQKLTYGIKSACDVQASNLTLSMTGTEFQITSPWGAHSLHIKLLGHFNVYNALAVFCCLMADGLPLKDVIHTLSQLKAAPGRMEVVALNPCVIVDYAHSPDALENVLQTLAKLKRREIIAVFGCGGERDKEKRPMMGRIASQYSDKIIITSDNPRREDPDLIIKEIAAGVDAASDVTKITRRDEAIAEAINLAKSDDIILIAGKGHESYQQIDLERFDFSDQKVTRRLLGL